MAGILYTVDNMVAEVRSLLDETNVDSVDTKLDILPSLNRAQMFAFDIYSRRYPEPLLEYAALPLQDNVAEYTLPEYLFEDRLLKIEIKMPSGAGAVYHELQRISYRDISNFESASTTNIPMGYTIFSRKIRFMPAPSGAFNARIWYLRQPEKLVLPQGRITKINTDSNYAILDAAGSDLTTEADQLGSYVNWIDGQSGEVRATLQIQSINENRITFRAVPMRTSVLNKNVTGTMPSIGSPDDYLCSIEGICVPYYGTPTSNFLIQFAVAEITGKLGGDRGLEEQLLKKFEQQVEKAWVGREKSMRIQSRSPVWNYYRGRVRRGLY